MLRDNPMLGALAGPIGLITSLIANFDRLIAKVQQAKAAWKNFSIAKSAQSAWSSIQSAAGFSRGGYTGAGGVNEAAGIVHKGEVVFSQRDVAKFGGWQAVERLRQGGAGMLTRLSERLRDSVSGSERSSPNMLPRPTRFAAPKSAGSLNIGGDTITINIHATATQSAQDIAQAVRAELSRLTAAKQRRANSSLRDKD